MNIPGQSELTRGQKIAEARKSNRERVNHWDMLNREPAEIVASGKCPKCGGGIHRNRGMPGLWQCDRMIDTPGPSLYCLWQILVDT